MFNCPECDANFGYIRKMFRVYAWKILRYINNRFLETHPGSEDHARCRDCGKTVHDFIMPNEIWNDVIAGSPIIYLSDGVTPSREGAAGVWCYDCFCERAGKKGYIPVFKCELAHPKVGLVHSEL